MNPVSHNCGKQRVRVMKVMRDAPRHEVKELECGVRLEGDFAARFPAGDNSLVLLAKEPHSQIGTTFTRA